MKQKILSKLKKATAIGLASLVGILPIGCGSNKTFIDKNLVTKPYIETAFVSDYVFGDGGLVRGQVRQDLVNFNLNDRLSAFVWQNYSHKENAFNERDFGFNYSFPINNKLSARAGYQYWDYPSKTFGDYDEALKAGMHYSGKIDLDYELTQLLSNKNTESGTRHSLKASKSFSIYNKNNLKVSLTPSISTAHIDNWYGKNGLSQVTPGINFGVNKGKFNANGFINKQFGQISEVEDITYNGISVGYKF